jgi:peptidoglycan/LPS O-acetylase OafA/YrhL
MLSHRPRYDTLDAWRGLACLLVIGFHSTNA